MKNNLKFTLTGLGLLAAALFGLYWAQSYMDSLYAFRSPLKDAPPAPASAPIPAQTRRAVVVLVDGLRYDTALDAAVMPYLSQLRQNAAWAEMRSRPPTYSTPSYVTLMTGAWADVSDGPAMNLEYEEIWPMTQDHIFAVARRQGYKTGISAYNWFEKLVPEADRTSGFFTPGEDHAADLEVMAAALPWLEDPSYSLVLIHLDQVDHAGHYEGGPLSKNWDAAAQRVDEMLRTIAAHLDFSKDTLLVISDHGHIDQGGHGGQDPITQSEPFLLVGAGVRPGTYEQVQIVDVAPTLAVLLGGNLPAASQGRALTEMLSLEPDEVAALRQAEKAQQGALFAAYTASIGQSAPVPEGDPVPSHQAALEAARLARLNRERLPRFLLAGVLFAIPLLWILRARPRRLPLMLAGVAIYLLVFHARYSWLDGKTYSLSSVPGATGFLIHTGTTALLAFAAAAVLVVLLTRRSRAGSAGSLVPGFTALLVFVLALPVLYSYGLSGNTFPWILPDYGSSFLSFISAAQMLFVGILGAFVAFGLAISATFSKTTPKGVETTASVPTQ